MNSIFKDKYDIFSKIIGLSIILVLEILPMQFYSAQTIPVIGQYFTPKTPIYWNLFQNGPYALLYTLVVLVLYSGIILMIFLPSKSEPVNLYIDYSLLIFLLYPIMFKVNSYLFVQLGGYVIPEKILFTGYFAIVWFSTVFLLYLRRFRNVNELIIDSNYTHEIYSPKFNDFFNYVDLVIFGYIVGSSIPMQLGYNLIGIPVFSDIIVDLIIFAIIQWAFRYFVKTKIRSITSLVIIFLMSFLPLTGYWNLFDVEPYLILLSNLILIVGYEVFISKKSMFHVKSVHEAS